MSLKCMKYLLRLMQGTRNWLLLRNEVVAGDLGKGRFLTIPHRVSFHFISCILILFNNSQILNKQK